ncbi:hypothetical protein [Mucilaginibacter phyllosphaerae]|uniref:Uncharacterized protein n=1 Tax=Mucilaginibacter phyllosphaerae TaxID=1812349 RepID=A0A4Y8AJD1_9SPHI|nr:hypothetical protein [Mucilaginibacter phyllosphaerae]MBB3971338.1 hypothetical protein [Mucilaginibacter phyllosphaerae]TEW68609.1 hypothetical protein E2R65_00120 [Mucilaginibacter phyllosphaerae]GGH24042.1 hypothetical protein GCM10007352_38310 [Mucilaginibacter phyllosphaerae]
MTDLNEYECEMLDAVLEAFGIPDSLTRRQLMELFDQDEATAFAMVQALAREGLIATSGKHGDYELPEKLILKPKGEKFLKQGGFTKRYHTEQNKPVEVGGTLAKLQQQNMKLQNQKLANESELKNLQKVVKQLQTRQVIWWVLIVVALITGYLIGHAHKG